MTAPDESARRPAGQAAAEDETDDTPRLEDAMCSGGPARWLRDEIDAGRIPALIAGNKRLVHLPTVAALLADRAKRGTGADDAR
jgi:hypothetical protein